MHKLDPETLHELDVMEEHGLVPIAQPLLIMLVQCQLPAKLYGLIPIELNQNTHLATTELT